MSKRVRERKKGEESKREREGTFLRERERERERRRATERETSCLRRKELLNLLTLPSDNTAQGVEGTSPRVFDRISRSVNVSEIDGHIYTHAPCIRIHIRTAIDRKRVTERELTHKRYTDAVGGERERERKREERRREARKETCGIERKR